jgi:hypothetical protein
LKNSQHGFFLIKIFTTSIQLKSSTNFKNHQLLAHNYLIYIFKK